MCLCVHVGLFQLVAVHLPQSGDQLVEAQDLSSVLSDVSSNPAAIAFGRGVCTQALWSPTHTWHCKVKAQLCFSIHWSDLKAVLEGFCSVTIDYNQTGVSARFVSVWLQRSCIGSFSVLSLLCNCYTEIVLQIQAKMFYGFVILCCCMCAIRTKCDHPHRGGISLQLKVCSWRSFSSRSRSPTGETLQLSGVMMFNWPWNLNERLFKTFNIKHNVNVIPEYS